MMDRDMDGSNPLLPQDIITNILMRLPVKSLIRFQCVCKFWKNLFKTPSFIAEHLHHSSHQNPSLIFEDFGKSDHFRLYLLDREMQILELPDNPFFDVEGSSVFPFGSCNGLVCMGFFSTSLSLLVWNPATREVRRLPRSGSYFEDEEFYVGFGFSPIVDDYKIVKINAQEHDGAVNQVKVFSLSIGSWRDVQFGNLDGLVMDSNGFSFNGAIFWIGSKLGEHSDADDIDIIISFDIATELFTLIPMPSSPCSVSYSAYTKYLTTHENKLALLARTVSGDFKSSLIYLWVMEEGTCARRWCWTKKYTSGPYLGFLLFPVNIWRNEIVCNVNVLPYRERKMVMFNYITSEFKTIDICKFVHGDGMLNYAESLVPVGNIHVE